MTTKKKGRPKGYSPGLRRKITHRVGAWSWNTETLHARIVKTEPNACWAWTGSKNPHGNIFGAFKNDHSQMTQTNRLLYMEKVMTPIDDVIVRMTCHNSYCCNPDHFEARPNKRRGPYKKKS
jgi:hypothetical protein